MATIDKVKEVISKQLNKPVEEIAGNQEVVKDLGADSLDIVEMIMNLEDEFGISVPEDEAVNIKTVDDIANLIDSISK
ncbi:MAG: acyl carrier protein [Clostridiales bacterium]|nr:acyl carrier protein [Clostridiales bacterium]